MPKLGTCQREPPTCMSKRGMWKRKLGPEPVRRREVIQWPLHKVPRAGDGKGVGSRDTQGSPEWWFLAGNTRIFSCQGCQGTYSQGQEYVFQSVFPVKCVWHILRLAEALLQISFWSFLIFLIRTRDPFLWVFKVLTSSSIYLNL